MNLFSPVKVPKFVYSSENLLSKGRFNLYNAIFCAYIYTYMYIYSVHMPHWVLV